MKKFTKGILSSVLVILLLVAQCMPAFAAASITFKGFSSGFEFKPGSEYTETDLFENFKGVMPGDVITEDITFTNAATDCDFIQLYMRAEAHDEEDNPLSDKVAETETVATMTDFLSQLSMKVWNGAELIYEASPDELDGLRENKFLGVYRTGETTTLKVELTVPIELGNEYANRVGEVDWIFHVEAYNESQLSVRKVWSDGNFMHALDKVVVNLLKDGVVEDSATLEPENGWAYTFDGLVEGHAWTVEEDEVPLGYTVSYITSGTTTTIINTKIPTPPTKPTDPTTPTEPDEPTTKPTEPSKPTEPTKPTEPSTKPVKPITPDNPGEPLDITVVKKWSNLGVGDKPAAVTVTLYNGKDVYDAVILNEKNNWTYHWEDLDEKGNWQVIETNIPKGFTPSYSVSNDGTVTITNTRKLIQTGQFNWPIVVLGGVGFTLIILGGVMLLVRRKRSVV